MKKIGIIGSGVVAQSLGKGFLDHGYQVMLGTRTSEKLKEWLGGNGEGAQVSSFAEAAAFGDILVLAVRGDIAEEVLKSIAAQHLQDKVVMDATNPISSAPPENGVLQFFTPQNDSLMETLQKGFPKVHFVKVFNSVGSAHMVNPSFQAKPSMFICGNSQTAKAEVSTILDQFGWETEDMGAVEAARAIEPLCMLWCIPGFLKNEWNHAFKLLKK